MKKHLHKLTKANFYQVVLVFIVIAAAFLRFYNLNWDSGHYLHPDERLYVNASNLSFPPTISSFFSTESPLNPKMFYYGSFPLYVYKGMHAFFSPEGNILITSRFISAFFSTITVILIYFLGKSIFNKKTGIIASILFAFAPGSIQYAHFNTTESILIFLLVAITYLSIQLYKNASSKLIFPLAILCGLAVATKITGLTFLLITGIYFLKLLSQKSYIKLILTSFALLTITALTAFIAAPYQFIDWDRFYLEQEFMQGVILGKNKPPFTIIYEGTIPYLYPLFQGMPFIFGFITFIFSLIGVAFLIKHFLRSKKNRLLIFFIIAIPIVYFLWAGSWYAKFARYYLLMLPFACIWASYIIVKLNKKIAIPLLFLAIINGSLYLNVYMKPHTRVAASEWIYENISEGSAITGEHWDDNLPLPIGNLSYTLYNQMQLNVYDLETDEKITNISQILSSSDYFVISSRRVSYSIVVNNNQYPITSRLYSLLDDENIGYKKIKEFTNYPFFISDDWADESFQTYDHPPVKIYSNEAKLSAQEIESILND